MDAFGLWMYSLDPVKLAAEESFVGERHRQLLFEHEVRRVEYHRSFLTMSALQAAAAFWANAGERQADTPVKTRKKGRLSQPRLRIEPRVPPVFTSQQLDIATKALEKKRG
jgi:hypothetical protein